MDAFNQLAPSDRDYFSASREVRYGTTLEHFVANSMQHRLELQQLLAPLRKTLGQQAFIAGDAPAYTGLLCLWRLHVGALHQCAGGV